MVRSRNMTTWPQPYFWPGDAGVSQCLERYQFGGYCFIFQNKFGGQLSDHCAPFEQWLQRHEDQ